MIKKAISTTCCGIVLVISLFALVLGISSIGAEGLSGIGIIFIPISILTTILVYIDYKIAKSNNKKGLIYSIIISLFKIILIILFIPNITYQYNYQIKYGVSNFWFYLFLLFVLIAFTIPSLLNIVDVLERRKNKKR